MSSLARFFLFFFSLSLPHVRSQAGFSSELIPWDSPKSPFYDPSLTQFDRVNAWIRHSIARHKQLSTQTESSNVTAADGAYLMYVNIGEPPIKIVAVADTGSDLIWTQCLPCVNCYAQRDPIYDPSESASYETVPCDDDERHCSFVPRGECDSNSTCQYTIAYTDGSKSVGVLSRDYLSVGDSDDDNEIAFGCSHSTTGNFGEIIAGIVGLGGGPMSLVSQLAKDVDEQFYKFSYCLAPANTENSKIYLGDNPKMSKNAITIPLVEGLSSTYYTVRLESIRVAGMKEITVSTDAGVDDSDQPGDIIVDSGTTLTYMDDSVVNRLVDQIKKAKEVWWYKITDDPEGFFPLCYDTSGTWWDVNLPQLTFQFSGATLTLPWGNTFIQARPNVFCLTIVSSSGQPQVLGNIAQWHLQVEYNLKNRTLSFAPDGCSNF